MRRCHGTSLLAALTLAMAPVAAVADEPGGVSKAPALEDMSLEDLLAVPVAVATPSKPQPARESPGIVTVITREEIARSGARDLIDVLSLVPGIHFGVDVQGVVGIGIRGVWGHEGKVLLLVDGQEYNELDYSTTQFGAHLPVDQIRKIELIRGPGSVLYGGFAELAVINVITRSAKDVNGFTASFNYGRTGRTLARGTASLLYAAHVPGVEGLDISIGTFLGQGTRSDRTYRDLTPDRNGFDMAGSSALDPRYLNVGIAYKGLSARFIHDDLRTTMRDGFGPVMPGAVEQTFPSYYAEARYDARIGDKLTITPRFNFKRQEPYRILDRGSDFYCNRFNEKYTGRLTVSWDPVPALNVLAGVEGYLERDGQIDREMIGLHRPYSNGDTRVMYQDAALLGQVSYDNFIANVTLGARYEYHSEFGHSFVPRFAVTKQVDWYHAKLLISQAFRSPSAMNLALNKGLKPEKTTVYEVEMGARIGQWMMLAVNVFDQRIDDAIVFQSVQENGVNKETYSNSAKTGSSGVEAEVMFRHPRVWARVGYSWYTAWKRNGVDIYKVPGRTGVMLGFPGHKATALGGVNVTDHLSVSPSAIVMGERHGVSGRDAAGGPVTRKYGPTAMVNLFCEYRDAGLKGLDIGIGAYNILDADIPYLSPYDGGHAPLPSLSREWMGRLTYTHVFK